jgi:hypothetical protein
MRDEIRELEEITGMRDPEPDPGDLWSLYDAPHERTLPDPEVFLAFARSRSTESVWCVSAGRVINFHAAGPHGGKVSLVALPSKLDRETRRELGRARTGVYGPSKEPCLPYS